MRLATTLIAPLDPEQLFCYDSDGYLVTRELFTPGEMEALVSGDDGGAPWLHDGRMADMYRSIYRREPHMIDCRLMRGAARHQRRLFCLRDLCPNPSKYLMGVILALEAMDRRSMAIEVFPTPNLQTTSYADVDRSSAHTVDLLPGDALLFHQGLPLRMLQTDSLSRPPQFLRMIWADCGSTRSCELFYIMTSLTRLWQNLLVPSLHGVGTYYA